MARAATVRRDDLADDELLRMLRAGDNGAFADLVGRHRSVALSVARKLLPGDTASAEDAVEDAITATLRAIRNGNGPDHDFRPYFLAATRTAAFDVGRRRLSPVSPEHALATDGSEFSRAESGHELMVLNECFHRLRPAWRYVLWQVHVDGMSAPAVADELGVSRRAVDATCQRARRHLARDYVAHLLPTQRGTSTCTSLQHHIADYGLGLSSDGAGELIESHLSQCGSCRARVEAVRRIPEQLPTLPPPVAVGVWKLLASLFIGNAGAGVGAIGVACLVAVTPLVPSDQTVASAPAAIRVHDGDGASVDEAAPDESVAVTTRRDAPPPGASSEGTPTPPTPSVSDESPAPGEVVVAESASGNTTTVTSPVTPTLVAAGPVEANVEANISNDLSAGQVVVDLAITTPLTTIAAAVDVGVNLGADPNIQVQVSTNLTVPILNVTVPAVSLDVPLPLPVTVPITLPPITLPPISLPDLHLF